MEELNLMDLLQYYVKKLPFIVIFVVAVIAFGTVYILKIQTPLYHGTTSIVLVQSNNNENTNLTQSELNLSEKLVSTYSEIIKSKRVLSQVVDSLRLECSWKELVSDITVSSLSETAIIKIVVSNEDSSMATNIANKIAEVFSKEVADIYNLENIYVLDRAEIEDDPYNINFVKQILIYTAAAIVISCVIVFVMYYFDDTIKGKKEIEAKIKVPVLGEIPLVSKANLKSQYYSMERNETKEEKSKPEKKKGDK